MILRSSRSRLLTSGVVGGIALAAGVAAFGQATAPTSTPQAATPPSTASPAGAPPGSPLTGRGAWLYNPRERTHTAIRALEEGQPDEAVTAATTAHDIDPANQLGTFNLGTVRLLAGDAGGAVEPLTRIAEADSELGVDAAYNLGSAHHQAQELEQAIHWYEETLRRDTSRVDAKINLELALQQRRQEKQQDSGQPDQQQSEQEEQSSPEQRTSQDEEQDQNEGPTEEQQDLSQSEEQESPLPQFQPRPDMTAEEAASLLEAVEAMEREAREEMQPETRRAAPGDRDW